MTLLTPAPPNQAAAAVQSTFTTLNERSGFRSPAMRNAVGPLQLHEPHQVFTLGLVDLLANRGLTAAKPTGWRYLVHESGKPVAAAESVVGADGDTHFFSAFNEGRFVASTASAIATARALPTVQKSDFELRLLHVPALYVMAIWLHEPQGVGDLLIPLAPSPVAAPTGQAIPAAQLLQELSVKARAAASPDDTSGG